ncbi:S-locus glycoprotein [Corchorus capsularis]|uniref:S-locus glycoprotein n=1 Tax=Corchorus capsularis TaxID=210143 RepID=A0A1R3I0T7_COCAP|nr:S-locus glycoprotein [Corchorus capsularis]
MPCSNLHTSLLKLFTLLLFTSCSLIVANATVPTSRTFKYINQGDFGEYTVEYLADYRVTPIYTFPFTVCFYNTTPNAFTLALRMGTKRSESIMRWVWEANRGRPVRENATLTFGKDGNLVLADADGTVAWQTGTANKGVVGLDLLENGNLVLYDKKGKFIWQSFDHPTDTLLVGQALRSNGSNKLVSRTSISDGSEGPYSFVMEGRYYKLYYKTKNSPTPLLYYMSYEFGNGQGSLTNLKFYCNPETEQGYAFELGFTWDMSNSPSFGTHILARPKYNSTYSMLRVESDGNLKIYTYNENVDWGAWENTFKLFDGDDHESLCQLPQRCGSLGICDDNQCVSCPKPKGLFGWSKSCAPPVLPPCKSGGANVGYYKVVGVEHFTNAYTEGIGPMKLNDCRVKCSNDCGCLGFFYREESSKCLQVPELGTLVKVSNSSHVAYIKMPK